MKQIMHFEIIINAPVEKVWNTMLELETYKQWTTPFDPTSYFEGSWEKGSKIKFLSSEREGGMASEIAENIPNKFLSIKHTGEIKNGVVVEWPSMSFENYTFTEKEGQTHLGVDMDIDTTPELKGMKEMFEDMWPKALAKLKEICEK